MKKLVSVMLILVLVLSVGTMAFADNNAVTVTKSPTDEVRFVGDNAIFTAFAPFDDPEIVVASVLEQGNTGSNAGRCVRDVFDYYFNIDENAPEEPDDGGDE